MPLDWEESDPRYITNAADVKLRAFSTKVGSRGWRLRVHSAARPAHVRMNSWLGHHRSHNVHLPFHPPCTLCQVHNVEALVQFKTEDD